jgi:hypothetical protein
VVVVRLSWAVTIRKPYSIHSSEGTNVKWTLGF